MQLIKVATSVDLQHESERLFSLYDKWVKNEGVRSATLRLKALHHIVLNHSLGQVPPQYPFIATTQGFPRAVVYLRKFVTSPEGIQAVLSLLGYWRGVRCPGIPDLESISALSDVEYPIELEELICEEIPDKWEFDIDRLAPTNHQFTTRFGPNGRRLLSALSDLKALERDPKLMGSLTRILELTNSEEFADYLDELRNEVNIEELPATVTHSRLSVKQELGGKDRIFAMVDYFSQCALRPLHLKIAEILRTINQDGTWDQDKAAEKVKHWTSRFTDLYSIDLTAATDRFPARLQRAVLETLTGSKDYADAWLDLMTNRDFKFRSKTGIRYSVGQPMGAYSSWPMFALTHHLLVMTSAKQVGISRPEYVLLGDDICIRSKALADSYLRNLQLLGVKTSKTKTVTGKVAEFAKRLFTQGGEISGIPVKLVQSTIRDFRLIKTLHQRLMSQSFGVNDPRSVQSALGDFADRFYPKSIAAKARILLALPLRETEGLDSLLNLAGKVQIQGTIPFQEWQLCLTFVRYKYLVQRYSEEVKRLAPKVGSWACAHNQPKVLIPGLPSRLPGLDTGHQDLHPVSQAYQISLSSTSKAHKALGKYWTVLSQQGPSAKMPSVNLPDIKDLSPAYHRRLKQEATVLLQAYEAFSSYLDERENHPDLSFLDYSKKKGKKSA